MIRYERILKKQAVLAKKILDEEAGPDANIELVSYGRPQYKIIDEPLEPGVPVIQRITDKMAANLAAKLDDLIRNGINQQLGSADLVVDELHGRLVKNIMPDGREIYCLDGVAFLETWPVDFSLDNFSSQLHGSFNYRYLVPERSPGSDTASPG